MEYNQDDKKIEIITKNGSNYILDKNGLKIDSSKHYEFIVETKNGEILCTDNDLEKLSKMHNDFLNNKDVIKITPIFKK